MSNRSKQRKLNQRVFEQLTKAGDLAIKVTRITNVIKHIRKTKTNDDKTYYNWLNKHED